MTGTLAAYTRPMRLTAVITREGQWYVAQCLEVDVASQGESVDEARDNLAEALRLYLSDGDAVISEPPVVTTIDLD